MLTAKKKQKNKVVTKKITLEDLYKAGWGKHVVENSPGHKVETCPVCQKIIKLGHQLNAQMTAEERAERPKIERRNVTLEEYKTMKELIKDRWTPREIAECLNRYPETIRLYLRQKNLPVYTIKKAYIVTNEKTNKVHKVCSLKSVGSLIGLSPSRLSTLINLGDTEVHGYKIDIEKSRVKVGEK
jgi:hypothetical protein